MPTPIAMSLVDWQKTRAPRGGLASVTNVLSQRLDVVNQMLWVEGNLDTGHRTTIATGLPDVYWRSYNLGIPSSKMTTAQVDEACAKMESHSECDRELAELGGNAAQYRALRANHYIESMGQKFLETLFYGNASIGDGFTGLAPRYSSTLAGNGQNVLKAGGTTGNQTSLWLVCLSAETIFGIFPRGMMAGLVTRDLDVQLIRRVDAAAVERTFEAYVEIFKWDVGLCVADWRYGVRICNLQVADLQGLSGTQTPTNTNNILHSILKAIDILPSQNMGKCMLIGNRLVKNTITRIAAEKSSAAVTFDKAANQFGDQRQQQMYVQGIPYFICDKLLNTEGLVT
jgi:hypothetical protein